MSDIKKNDIQDEDLESVDKDFESVVELREEEIESQFTELLKLVDERSYGEFLRAIEELNPIDAADFFSELDQKKIPAIFKLLRKDFAAEIFAELDPDLQEKVIEAMTDREISVIVEELFVDDAVDMLSELPAGMVTKIMRHVSPDIRAEINRFLAYPEGSAGSIMTAEFVDLRGNMTCSEAIKHIRRTGVDKETVYTLYVTDDKRVLQGTVSFKDLLFAKADAKISDIMTEEPICASTVDDKEVAADVISKYDLLVLPIVDKELRLVGIVTVDDALDVIREEATEDIEMMAAITPTDKPYIKTGVFETWKKRFPWLLILMLSAVFSGAILTHYENAIGTYAILTAFVPMLMNTGGNAGSQSSVAIIRALSLDEISMRDFFRVVWKEFRVSALCGAGLAAVCFIKTMAIDFGFRTTTVFEGGIVQNNFVIAGVISATAFFAVVIAKIVGSMLPMGAKKIGLDPAVMASPFITTIVDTITLIIYFAIASRALGF